MRTLQEAIAALQAQRDEKERQLHQNEEDQKRAKLARESSAADAFGNWLEKSEDIVLNSVESRIEAREYETPHDDCDGTYEFKISLTNLGWISLMPQHVHLENLTLLAERGSLTWTAHYFKGRSQFAMNHESFVAAALELWHNKPPKEIDPGSETVQEDV